MPCMLHILRSEEHGARLYAALPMLRYSFLASPRFIATSACLLTNFLSFNEKHDHVGARYHASPPRRRATTVSRVT